MLRLSSVALAVAAAAVLVAAGCSSDQPKRVDDAGAVTDAPADAANHVADPPKDVAGGGGSDAGTAVPVVEQQVDAGHMGDADHGDAGSAKPAGVDADGSGPKKPTVDPIQVTIFNRLLVKPKEKLSPAQVQEIAEDVTGEKVETVRRTAGTFFLIQFSPTTPPRTAKEQKALIAKLQKSFSIVEGDQIMTIK